MLAGFVTYMRSLAANTNFDVWHKINYSVTRTKLNNLFVFVLCSYRNIYYSYDMLINFVVIVMVTICATVRRWEY